MTETAVTLSNKEIFYITLMLGGERLVGVEYDFPIDEALLMQELGEVKRGLNKRKLLRENSKGEVSMEYTLTAVAGFCSQPDVCLIVDEEGLKGTVYKVGESSLLLEPAENDEFNASVFTSEKALGEYIGSRIWQGMEDSTDG